MRPLQQLTRWHDGLVEDAVGHGAVAGLVALVAGIVAWVVDRRRRSFADRPTTPAAAVFAGRERGTRLTLSSNGAAGGLAGLARCRSRAAVETRPWRRRQHLGTAG